MGKLDIKKKMKHESLLNTAFDLFTSQGINKTSISDIVKKAGVAKGTFYLYFSDKFDLRNKLISHKASQLFLDAHQALTDAQIVLFEDKIIFIIDHIINALNKNPALLTFINKNLSWGVFKSVLESPGTGEDINFYDVYQDLLAESPYQFKHPEIMIFMIVELVGSTTYSAIIEQDPVDLDTLKPYLYETILNIIKAQKL